MTMNYLLHRTFHVSALSHFINFLTSAGLMCQHKVGPKMSKTFTFLGKEQQQKEWANAEIT